MSNLAALPLAILFVAAAISMTCWRAPRLQRALAVAACVAVLASAVGLVIVVADAGPLVLAVGGWAAPMGISLRVDMVAALMVLVTGLLGASIAVYSLAGAPASQARRGYWPALSFLLMGVCGAFLAADLFNLYVWFEVMLIASFVLLALGGTRAQLRAALVYVAMNLISSALFLVAVGLIYGAVRTLDFATLGVWLGELHAAEPRVALAIQATLLVSFAIKAAVFPLFFWLPASYHAPAPPVSALFAGLLTKVGVYAMLRATAELFASPPIVYDVLGAVAMATMVSGVLGALAQSDMRRVLSFHIVSQVGYMVAGLALARGDTRSVAIAATLFYVIHHIVVKANLFLVSGVVMRLRGSESLARLGGVAGLHPWLAVLFLVPALSLAGVPPLSGFWAKLAIIDAGIDAGQPALVAVAVVTGLLTLLSMLKIWLGVFAGPAPADARPSRALTRRESAALFGPIALLALVTLVIGLAPGVLLALANAAAAGLTSSPPGGAP